MDRLQLCCSHSILGIFAGEHGSLSGLQIIIQERQMRVIPQHNIKQKGGL